MGDDVLATQGARASATIICTTLNQINLFGPCTLKSYRGMGVVGMSNVSTVFLVIIRGMGVVGMSNVSTVFLVIIRGMGVVGMSNVSTVFLVIIWKKKKRVSLLQTWCIYCGVSFQKLFNFGPHWTNHGPVVGQKWMEMVISGDYLEKLFDFGPQWMTRAGPNFNRLWPSYDRKWQ